ncbi:hypothetical protein LZ30DRAFT_683658 [Colletotrichum cereale]|nr:hypothetical protein LZ30DRAFT_683658 [Colletotrichum cereale]
MGECKTRPLISSASRLSGLPASRAGRAAVFPERPDTPWALRTFELLTATGCVLVQWFPFDPDPWSGSGSVAFGRPSINGWEMRQLKPYTAQFICLPRLKAIGSERRTYVCLPLATVVTCIVSFRMLSPCHAVPCHGGTGHTFPTFYSKPSKIVHHRPVTTHHYARSAAPVSQIHTPSLVGPV